MHTPKETLGTVRVQLAVPFLGTASGQVGVKLVSAFTQSHESPGKRQGLSSPLQSLAKLPNNMFQLTIDLLLRLSNVVVTWEFQPTGC